MGTTNPGGGYSAKVEAYFAHDGRSLPLAKTNDRQITFAWQCSVLPGTVGDLVVIIDGHVSSRRIVLPQGKMADSAVASYCEV